MLPPRLLSGYQGARKVVELAAGTQWAEALAVARALPGCEVIVTDIDPRVRDAPKPLRGAVDDLTRPALEVYQDAALLYAVRLPEELHVPAARLAERVRADLALRMLGAEAPAAGLGPPEVFPDRWMRWRFG